MMVLKNRKIITTFTIFLFFISGFAASSAKADPNPPRKIFSGWLTYYGISKGVPSILNNSDLISEISPFWYTYTDSQTISDLYTPANPYLPIATTINQLKNAGLLLLPTITDSMKKGGMANLIADPTSRSNLISQISNLVTSNQYDGIELDFENFAFVDGTSSWASTQPNWIEFIKELSATLHSNHKLLAIDSPVQFNPTSGKKGYWVYSWADIAPYIDRLRIMGYDYSTSTPGPIGPVGWEDMAINYAISVMPASKVYLGIPGYGRNWTTKVTGVCPSDVAGVVSTKSPAATFIQSDADTLAASLNATPTYDKDSGEATFTYQKIYNGFTANNQPTTCTQYGVVWYQNDQSFALRAQLVAKYHLGGIMEWTLGFESQNSISQIRTIAENIAPDPVISNLNIPNSSYLWGNYIPITLTSKLKDSSPVSGINFHLQRQDASGNWNEIASGVTDQNGNYQGELLLGNTAPLRIITDGNWSKASSVSNIVNLNIAPNLVLTAPSNVALNQTFTLSGVVNGASVGDQVEIDSNNKVLSTSALSGNNFSFLIQESSPGIYRYQIRIKGVSGELATAWATVLVR